MIRIIQNYDKKNQQKQTKDFMCEVKQMSDLMECDKQTTGCSRISQRKFTLLVSEYVWSKTRNTLEKPLHLTIFTHSRCGVTVKYVRCEECDKWLMIFNYCYTNRGRTLLHETIFEGRVEENNTPKHQGDQEKSTYCK